eukprot:GILI01020894.1.p1 GENE.GILI01020894.1~~GILI01020894.1.p1  ORF type:complete len:391 (-),score=-0.09 GILI01020894.1:32-1204(-)
MHASTFNKIAESEIKFCLSFSQGCSSLLASLLSYPTSEQIFTSASIYNSTEEIHSQLENSTLDPNTIALQLSQRAWRTASSTNPSVCGVGISCIPSEDVNSKVYLMSFWFASEIQNSFQIHEYSIDSSVSDPVLVLILGISSVTNSDDEKTLLEVFPNRRHWEMSANPIGLVLTGALNYVVFNSKGDMRTNSDPFYPEDYDTSNRNFILLLFPGSFNPLHWGHSELASAAISTAKKLPQHAGKIGARLTYEISTTIVDKKPADVDEITVRLNQFLTSGRRVAITSAKLFVDKAKIFENHGFVVGMDTVRRILDVTYYNDSEDKMIEALLEIGNHGCCFIVGGRKNACGEWDALSNLSIPKCINHLFIEIGTNDFRVDISSTDLRAQRIVT